MAGVARRRAPERRWSGDRSADVTTLRTAPCRYTATPATPSADLGLSNGGLRQADQRAWNCLSSREASRWVATLRGGHASRQKAAGFRKLPVATTFARSLATYSLEVATVGAPSASTNKPGTSASQAIPGIANRPSTQGMWPTGACDGRRRQGRRRAGRRDRSGAAQGLIWVVFDPSRDYPQDERPITLAASCPSGKSTAIRSNACNRQSAYLY
jgi:hypothetical protein